MGDLNGRLPAVKAWDDGTTEMEQACVPMWHLGCDAINALEAELAALKGRRCETCRSHQPDDWCIELEFDTEPDFACNRWAAREEGE
jgi:hypothetical protein